MRKIVTTLSILIFFFFLSGSLSSVHAATRTWDGGGATASWDECANWDGPDLCPTSADAVVFSATSTKSSSVTVGSNFLGTITSLSINSGYTGTITQTSPLIITSTMSHTAAATYTAAGQTLSVGGNFTLNNASAIFTASSVTTTFSAGFTITTGTFNANGGTVVFNGVAGPTLSCNNATFVLVSITTAHVISSNCSLPLGNDPTVTGNQTLNGTFSGTGTLNPSPGQTLTLNSGAALTGFTGINTTGNFTVAGATLNLTTLTTFVSAATVSISSGSLSLPSGADLNGALSISGGTFTAPSGSMTVAGALTISGTPVFNANGGTITFDGAGATLACNNVTFNRVTFANTATKIVNSTCTLPLGSDPVINSGGGITLSGILIGSGTLYFTGASFPTFQFLSGGTLSGFSGLSFAGGSGTLTISGATFDLSSYSTVSLVFLILSSGTLIAPSGTMDISGGITTTSGVLNANGGTIQLIDYPFSNGNQTFSGSNTYYNLRKTTSKNAVTISSGSTQTILGTLTLSPVTGILAFRASVSGTPWKIDARGGRMLSNLNVKDSTNLNTATMIATSSIDAGNNTGWSFSPTSQLIQINVDSPGDITYTNNDRPIFRWNPAVSLGNASIASYSLFAGDFNVLDIAASRTTDLETSKYRLGYKNFSDSDPTNNQIEVQTKSSSEWNRDLVSGQNDGKIKEGIVRWRLEAHDSVGNISDTGRTLFVDLTNPTIKIIQKSYIKKSPVPTWYGKVIDSLSGPSTPAQTENGPKVASGPKEIQFVVERKTTKGYVSVETLTTPVSRPWWTCTNTDVKDDFKQNCDKYIPFSFTPLKIRASGDYRITISATDQAGNKSNSVQQFRAGVIQKL